MAKFGIFKFIFLLTLFIVPLTNIYAGYFVVETTGDDVIVVNNGSSQYIIKYNYECYSSDFLEGSTIYIDASYTPMYGDTIVTSGYFEKTCEVADAEDVNLKKYFVEKVLDNDDKIIIADKLGDSYLVEYGIGCGLSFWRYEGKIIDIDIGGAFLDGIGDQIYLLDDGDDCKVWDAEELSGNYSGVPSYSSDATYSTPTPTPTPSTSCPINSYNNNGQCLCNSGYIVNPNKTACVPAPSCPEGSFLNTNNLCTTYTQSCREVNNNDINIIGSKGADGKINCICNNGMNWNGSQCVLNSTPVKTEIGAGLLGNIQVSKPVETKKESPKIDENKIKLLDKEIPTKLKLAGTLRQCPSTNCAVIRHYVENSTFQVIGDYNNGEWFKIKAKNDNGNNIEGWMHNSVLEKITTPTKEGFVPVTEVKSEEKATATTSTSVTSKKSWIKIVWHFFFGKNK